MPTGLLRTAGSTAFVADLRAEVRSSTTDNGRAGLLLDLDGLGPGEIASPSAPHVCDTILPVPVGRYLPTVESLLPPGPLLEGTVGTLRGGAVDLLSLSVAAHAGLEVTFDMAGPPPPGDVDVELRASLTFAGATWDFVWRQIDGATTAQAGRCLHAPCDTRAVHDVKATVAYDGATHVTLTVSWDVLDGPRPGASIVRAQAQAFAHVHEDVALLREVDVLPAGRHHVIPS